MKAGILTIYKTGNYGATLQAYATKKAVEALGAEAEILPYCAKSIETKIDREFIRRRGMFGTAVALAEKLYYAPRMKKTMRWVESYAPGPMLSRADLARLNGQYDVFIAGSDQIWNPDIQHGDYAYFLDFVDEPTQKCSYASSFGTDTLAGDYRDTCAALLHGYRVLTVREESGADLVEQLTGIRPPVVLDPTMLLARETWESLLPPAKGKTKYIFVYQMAHSGMLARLAKAVRARAGGRIDFVPFPIGGACAAHCHLGLSPLEWARRIHDAEFVLTDSFHGLVFSILFHRPFYYVVTSDTVKKRLARATTLLASLGLSSRMLTQESQLDTAASIDWADVDNRLATLRERSLAQLERMVRP
ncbi:MAG: polysaccharide pyruvyl transferase family protein [Faecalibacterium sp.]|jgi:hypothetical protein|nr:polysaccharide pyruvyl transferase family protein [Faecalibacterium sp.]